MRSASWKYAVSYLGGMHACALAPHAAASNGTAIFFQVVLTDFSPGSLLLADHPLQPMLPVPDRIASVPTRPRATTFTHKLDNQLSIT
ncbi:hypothetical protein G3O06_19570 [Burkholderia sp. Ac-20345]|uniref:hypothetical protein n=1 Tax=Burkholderia TaxID=32008 RepID=UPI00158147B9|nr:MULTISPECIES: hypothetical protein [Burkholderia]MBN3779739.1 hypothetical protein [Burkholderia sp. Ac-20345]